MKALDISTIVITHFDYNGDLITNKKLQKLLYYIEAWSLVYISSVIDEDFEAWVHGPVIPSVYQEYKKFGYAPISTNYAEGETASSKLPGLIAKSGLSKESVDLMFAVLNRYGSLTSYQLETLSHSEKPWILRRGDASPLEHRSQVIEKDLMKEYYTSLIHA